MQTHIDRHIPLPFTHNLLKGIDEEMQPRWHEIEGDLEHFYC